MKKLLSTLASITALLLFAAAANALPIEGQQIRYTDAGPRIQLGDNSWVRGGLFSWQVEESGETFTSFCLERQQNIFPNISYEVKGISDSEISKQTNWLFSNYAEGNLDITGLDQDQIEKNMQVLVWFFEEEITESQYNYYAGNNSSVTAWFALADTNAINWVNNDRVKAINLGTEAQDQLVYNTAHAPEPSTMVLFGIGLIGTAGFCRRK